jgi:hypothetical protein
MSRQVGTEARLRTALREAAPQAQPSADAWEKINGRRGRPSRRRFGVPAITAAVAVAVLVAVTAGVLLLRSDSPSVQTPASKSRETSPSKLLPLEADAAVYMLTDAPTLQDEVVRDFLRRSPDVRVFAYVDKSTAYEEFRRTFRDRPDLLSSVDPGALPASFRIRVRDCTSRLQLIESLKAVPGVDEAVTQLGLSRAEAERFRDRQGFPPSDTRGRCGDRPPPT